jgi:hypothetical protein
MKLRIFVVLCITLIAALKAQSPIMAYMEVPAVISRMEAVALKLESEAVINEWIAIAIPEAAAHFIGRAEGLRSGARAIRDAKPAPPSTGGN